MFDALLLRTFVAVVDEQGFSRAALKLHLTQSAVSGHLRRLEQQVGKPLLQRTTRSQQLTADGERLMAYARAILALNRDAWTELTRVPFHGRVGVGLSEDFADPRLLRALQDFAGRYPGIRLDVQVGIPGTLLDLLAQGNLQLVVGSLCETAEPGRLLWSEPLVWAGLVQPAGLLPDPLPLALFPEPCPYRAAALGRLAQAGIAQRTVMLCSSNWALRAAVLSGFAIAPMAASQLGAGLCALGEEYGLPPLPDAQYRLFTAPEADQTVLAALSEVFVEYCSSRRSAL
ncbi:DNA-binding transcriptional LysR family regulator [Pseudomonas protegens]|uniref:HTH-type transcriptional regulator PecT n=3 Tax=Pseudomonas TaxID=286 RepID=A0A2C9EJP8_PSEPH|nr:MULTISPECIES: LysR family transcriptional regulator [Pseudomonas]GED78453.1 transcriptional regulator [Pseudomonas fluorescens]AGL83864.1 HTH-type transcriptional regulator PecT [Pseudomonas protegens CHA0]AQT08831.1 LysR family transcriptional regulator [Pseudomonas protegens]MBB1614401.1 LysR family transcriptional regulator [Pseudomonas sp. UMC65]MBB1617776.1 LysR family transcriptional regulator [Pseudomonas sp. UME65]